MNNMLSKPGIAARGRSRPIAWGCLLALAILASLPLQVAYAQSKIVVKGTLEDSTGAAIPGVDVKLRSVDGGKELHASTDEDGFFQFDALRPGRYVVDVAAPGFEEVTQPLEIGTTPLHPLRIRLNLAQVKQKVTVTDRPYEITSAQQNTDYVQLDQSSFHNLPLKDGDPLAIPALFLEPATVGAKGPQLIVDGVETSSLDVPTASIKDVAVNKNPYTAEYSRPGKGRIEVTTRQGSRHRYRGLVSLLLRNSALDARNPFATTVPELQRGIGEAQLSGPLTRHTTFFVAGRYYTNNQASVINAFTPAGPFNENFMNPSRNYHVFGRLDYGRRGRKTSLIYKYKDKVKRNENVGGFNLPDTATDVFEQENEFKLLETDIISDHLINEARFTFRREPHGERSLTNAPAIIVPGEFKNGGAQVSQGLREASLTETDIVSYATGKHAMRFGGQVRTRLFDVYDASNFGGSFYFASLQDFEALKPLQFTMNEGNPNISFGQQEYFTFIQDEIRLRENFSLSLGLRHEFQSNARDYHAFAPRIAFAYAPGKGRTVIRAGAGYFYDRQPEGMEQQALLLNGSRIRKVIIQNPSFPLPFGSPNDATLGPPSAMRIAPRSALPYLIQENLTIEHRFGSGRNLLTVDFMGLRGLRLYRLRNVNAPLPGTTLRPDPNFINIDQYESSGFSRGNSVTVSYQTTLRRRFDLTAQYVLSKSMDNTPGILTSSLNSLLFVPVSMGDLYPANSYDMRDEWARSNFDRRHRFNLVGFCRMPWGFKTGAVVSLSSGIPYNITTGLDGNQDNIVNDRPAGVGRNAGHGPGYADVDFHLGKEFKLLRVAETARMEFSADAFNLFNTVNFKNFVGVMTSQHFFGRANAAQAARTLQLGFRFKF